MRRRGPFDSGSARGHEDDGHAFAPDRNLQFGETDSRSGTGTTAMNNRALRNRLLRLEQFAAKATAMSDPACDQFEIGLDLARQIRDDDWRAYQLSRKVFNM